MANEITNNIGIELPTPGVTGALGVELPGASWMELQNEGFRKVDAHDHGLNGGAPLDSTAFSIAADLSFNSYRATNLGSAQFVNQVAPLSAARSIYFYGGDFYIVNGSSAPVRITNGGSIAAAAGNITGLSGTAAISWNAGLGVFIFEQSTGVKAGIYAGPLSIFEPVSGGKKVTISVPAGLAADYALTLPTALPATKLALYLSATGVITAEAAAASLSVDGTSIINTAGVLSVNDLGISTAKLANASVTAAKLAPGAVSKASLAAVGEVRSASTGVPSAILGSGDVTNLTVRLPSTTGTRPIMLRLESNGANAGGIKVRDVNMTPGTDTVAVTFQRSPHGAGTWTVVGSMLIYSEDPTIVTDSPMFPASALSCVDSGATTGTDWDYKVAVSSSYAFTETSPVNLVLLAYEL